MTSQNAQSVGHSKLPAAFLLAGALPSTRLVCAVFALSPCIGFTTLLMLCVSDCRVAVVRLFNFSELCSAVCVRSVCACVHWCAEANALCLMLTRTVLTLCDACSRCALPDPHCSRSLPLTLPLLRPLRQRSLVSTIGCLGQWGQEAWTTGCVPLQKDSYDERWPPPAVWKRLTA